MKLNVNIANVKPSPTLSATARAKELRAAGKDIVSFTAGEPDLDTPDHVKKAAIAAIEEGFTKYTPVGGIPELKNVLIEKFKRDQGLEYKPEEVIVTNGGKHALAALFSVLLNDDDEVVIPAPYWTSYPDMAELAGAKPVIVKTRAEDEFLMTPEQLEKACTAKTRAIIINTPSNPTGSCYTKEQLQALSRVVSQLENKENIVVVSDEVYEYVTYDGFEHVSFAEASPAMFDNTVIVNAFSKAYSMTGWRVGYAAGPAKIIKAMTTLQSQATSNVCSIAQKAAAAAYEDSYAFPKKLAVEFGKRIDYVCDVVERIPGLRLAAKPKGAFYAFVLMQDLYGKKYGDKTIESSADFAEYLLNEHDTVVVQGEAFGFPGAFRISFAMAMEELEKGLVRIEKAVGELS